MSGKLTFSVGLPTEPDVKKIVEKYGVPAEGFEIAYEDIAKLIGVGVNTPRFRTVCNAWRKQLYTKNNVLLACVEGKGFKVCDPSDRTVNAAGKFKRGMRSVARGGDIAAKTDTSKLRPEEQRACEHISRTAAALRIAASQEAKRLKG